MTARPLATVLSFALAALVVLAAPARAEKADKEKPINFGADQVDANYERKTGSLKGNVILTQGTMTIRGDRMDFKQNADNSVSATVWGNPLSFRQKKDGVDEYFEGYAQRAEYDGTTEFLQLHDRALLRDGTNEIRGNYITYNAATGKFNAEGRPDQPGAAPGPGNRVRGTFQPREGTALPGPPGAAGKGAPAKGAPAKGNAKGDARDSASGGDAGKSAGAGSSASAPLKLTPDSAQKP